MISSQIGAIINHGQSVAIKGTSTTDIQDFQALLEKAVNQGEDEKLKEACQQMETYMLSMVLKQVEKSMLSQDEDSLLPKGEYIEMFQDTLITSLAERSSQAGGIGLANQLYEQMKRNRE